MTVGCFNNCLINRQLYVTVDCEVRGSLKSQLTTSVCNVPVQLTHKGWYSHLLLLCTCTAETFLSRLSKALLYLVLERARCYRHSLSPRFNASAPVNGVGVFCMRVQPGKGISKPRNPRAAQDPAQATECGLLSNIFQLQKAVIRNTSIFAIFFFF